MRVSFTCVVYLFTGVTFVCGFSIKAINPEEDNESTLIEMLEYHKRGEDVGKPQPRWRTGPSPGAWYYIMGHGDSKRTARLPDLEHLPVAAQRRLLYRFLANLSEYFSLKEHDGFLYGEYIEHPEETR